MDFAKIQKLSTIPASQTTDASLQNVAAEGPDQDVKNPALQEPGEQPVSSTIPETRAAVSFSMSRQPLSVSSAHSFNVVLGFLHSHFTLAFCFASEIWKKTWHHPTAEIAHGLIF